VLAVQILSFADDGLWGKLSALGIIMIIISTLLVLLAQYLGNRFKMQQKT
jgi:iron(III) transport system permease protein